MARKKRYPGVKRLDSKTYEVRVEYTCQKTGRVKTRRRRIPASSAAEASAFREKLALEAKEGTTQTTRLRLRNYAPLWLRGKVDTLESATATRYALELQNHILPAFGDFYLDAITRHDITDWRAKLAETYKPSSVNSFLRTGKLIIRDASREFKFDDPTVGISGVKESTGIEDDEGRVLELEEVAKLVTAAWEVVPQWAALIHLIAVTGMRFSEATALKWGDVDLEEGLLRIRRKQVRGVIGPPKTSKSRRLLPLIDEVRDLLAKRKFARKGKDDDWVFPSATGGLLFTGALTKPLRAAAAEAKLDYLPSAHWLRRSINRLLAQLAQGRVQKAILGHVTDRMSEHYDHVKTDEKRSAVAAIFDGQFPDIKPDTLPKRRASKRIKQR